MGHYLFTSQDFKANNAAASASQVPVDRAQLHAMSQKVNDAISLSTEAVPSPA